MAKGQWRCYVVGEVTNWKKSNTEENIGLGYIKISSSLELHVDVLECLYAYFATFMVAIQLPFANDQGSRVAAKGLVHKVDISIK